MKSLKNTALLLAMLFALGAFAVQSGAGQGPGQGQGPHHRMPSADEQVKDLTQKLNLSADQQTKVKSIVEDIHQQANAVMKDESLSQDDRRSKMRTLHENGMSRVREVLNDDQKKKFDQMRDEHMKDHPGGENPK
ncbi:MAG TPA: hypothetical protein VKZ53_06505 [Candidatus Angelobacter sp.]|nr:hypothetical protein [Candidatus Angelobacter sp.]